MTKDEYEIIRQRLEPSIIKVSIKDLVNRNPRTLLYGYTHARSTHHVYIEEGEIHLLVYSSANSEHFSGEFVPTGLVPNKRLYPEACDAEFCAFLKQQGVHLPFTTWSDKREPQQYHGKRFSAISGKAIF
jgi:hypothetical protein